MEHQTIRSRPGRPVDERLRDRRCDEILQAATGLFAKHGYASATTEMLVDKLGVGKGTIYRYFSNKRELFLATCDRLMHQLLDAIEAAAEQVEDPLDKIAQAIRRYLSFFAEHPEFVELLVQERAQLKDQQRPTYFEHMEADRETHREFFRQLIAQGRVRDVDVDRINDVLSDLVYGTMFTNYFTGRRRSPADQANDILEIVFNGILSPAERDRRMAASRSGPD
jgi:AcrR family transcriptional regulator